MLFSVGVDNIAFSRAILWNEVPVSRKKAKSSDSFTNILKAYYVEIQKEA